MSFSAPVADERVQSVEFSDGSMSVSLRDGRVISVPLAWYPRLLNATPVQRRNWEVAGGGFGIHWPDVDEDLSAEGLLRGAAAPRRNGGHGLELGHLDIANLPSGEFRLPFGPARTVQPSALDAAEENALQQTA